MSFIHDWHVHKHTHTHTDGHVHKHTHTQTHKHTYTHTHSHTHDTKIVVANSLSVLLTSLNFRTQPCAGQIVINTSTTCWIWWCIRKISTQRKLYTMECRTWDIVPIKPRASAQCNRPPHDDSGGKRTAARNSGIRLHRIPKLNKSTHFSWRRMLTVQKLCDISSVNTCATWKRTSQHTHTHTNTHIYVQTHTHLVITHKRGKEQFKETRSYLGLSDQTICVLRLWTRSSKSSQHRKQMMQASTYGSVEATDMRHLNATDKLKCYELFLRAVTTRDSRPATTFNVNSEQTAE